MRRTAYAGMLMLGLLLTAGASQAEINFPKLTGRVVDNAGMLDASAEREIAARLEAHEKAGGNQVVVVTLPDLQGYTIEDFGYQLGRHWGIGQKGEDNGVLLIVAKKERKVRIEVGYGLEGKLTDAIASNIINAVILPSFKGGKFSAGISAGVVGIVEALGGKYVFSQPSRSRTKQSGSSVFDLLFMLAFISVFALSGFRGRRRGGSALLTGVLLGSVLGGRGGGYSGGGGFGGGGGFSGGGGGFGGGGASGGW